MSLTLMAQHNLLRPNTITTPTLMTQHINSKWLISSELKLQIAIIVKTTKICNIVQDLESLTSYDMNSGKYIKQHHYKVIC